MAGCYNFLRLATAAGHLPDEAKRRLEPVKRRLFLMAGTSAALAASPSEKMQIGLIGSGGRGRTVMRRFTRHADVHDRRRFATCTNRISSKAFPTRAAARGPTATTSSCSPTRRSTRLSSRAPSTGTIACCSMRSPRARTSISRSLCATRRRRARRWCERCAHRIASSKSACSAAAMASTGKAATCAGGASSGAVRMVPHLLAQHRARAAQA